jgi:diguanylate cyclase (GGDEF)-like protein/PAS domain S-box-containing protein
MERILSCLTTEHDWRLVALAVVVCFVASFAAISLFHRARATEGRTRALWIATAGIATGFGIWSTHFVAMLAYDPGHGMAYGFGLTLVSLLAAMVVTGSGLAVAVEFRERWGAALGGAIVGAGVAVMHYLGMAALQLPGRIVWAPDLVAASILLGMLFGIAALVIAVRGDDWRATAPAAILLTLAIASHHFTAMGAVEVLPDPTRSIDALALSPTSLALSIAAVAVSVLAACLVAAFADRRWQARLQEQNVRLHMAINNMAQGLSMYDGDARLVVCNDRYRTMYGLPHTLIQAGSSLLDVLHARVAAGTLAVDPDEQFSATLKTVHDSGLPGRHFLDQCNGRSYSVSWRRMPSGGWVATHEDITERLAGERELERTRNFLDTVVENIPITLVVKNAADLSYVLVNRACEELLGVPRSELVGKSTYDFLPKDEADLIARHERSAIATGAVITEEYVVHTPSGGERRMSTKFAPINGADGKPEYVMGLVEDMTERKRAEEWILHLAHHDPLTDLPNRSAFSERLNEILARSRAAGESFAVLCVDLDRFKEVNDVFGHATGDALLLEMAKRFKTEAKNAFLARFGGDEFTLIVTDGPQPAAAGALADRLLAIAAEELEIGGHRVRGGLSIGVAVYPTDGADTETLLANADAALYRAKAEGRGTFRFFEAEMDTRLRDRRALQHDLRSALEQNQIVLHYQPQALMNGDIIGFEALARWQHPGRGTVTPDVFIPAAEENGLIIPIGEWILREACREAASWPKPLQIAINLSPAQFRHGDLAGLVHAVLLKTGLAPGRLELEITESVLISDFSRAISILRRLKSMGVQIAMDDFGTGYSSLSYLQAFPFDKIKIDRAFISNLDHNPQSAAIVRAVLGLGRGLNLPVVAEGVETESQLDFLVKESCDQMQGFLIGRPSPMDAYAALVGREGAPARLRAVAG